MTIPSLNKLLSVFNLRKPTINESDLATGPDLIVTGIPRSGTTYSCKLLHQYDNVVAIHEPLEILESLKSEDVPYGIATYYKQVRANILAGKPIENSLVDGEVTEDPAKSNVRQPYVPTVSSKRFVLATKHNRSYLIRLDQVREIMPDARIICIIRNPVDTIASWKTCPFPLLNSADLVNNPVGNINSPWLLEKYRPIVKRITEIADLGERRAAFWQHCSELVLEHASQMTIIRYEDMVERPAPTVAKMLDGIDAGELRKPFEASQSRSSKSQLTDDELQWIKRYCCETASALGYDLSAL